MRTHLRVLCCTSACLALVLSALPSLAQEEPVEPTSLAIVEDGTGANVEFMEGAWTQGEGYLEVKGTQSLAQRLLSRCVIGPGDFTVTATVSLAGLARSSAAFTVGDKSYFGFAGGHGKIFVTGPLFNDAYGTPIGEPFDFMTEGEPFDLEVKRVGDHLTISIDSKLVYEQDVITGAVGPVGFLPCRATMRIHAFRVTGVLGPYKAPNVPLPVRDNIKLDPRVEAMPSLPLGPFVRLSDGAIMGVDDRDAMISRDEGKTWQRQPIFKPEDNLRIRPERALLRTREGTLILIFSNEAVRHYSWDKAKNMPLPDMLLPSYAIRSVDEGKTWTDMTMLHGGWCGCTQDIIQTSNGNIVVPGQELLYDEGRHATIPYVSTDQGKTWLRTQFLDIGGQGDHSGAVEGTLEELKDGRLWLLMRSAHGFFYESFSEDQGLTWSQQKPSAVKSTSAPGKMKRLASGRLALIWNPIPGPGFKTREELRITFSEDEGKSWSPPQILATNQGSRASYPYVFERVPGELWITTMQGGLRATFKEEDFLKPWTKIVCFGDSTTAPRANVVVYPELLERELPEHGVEPWIINAGVPGDNTVGALNRLERDVLDHSPSVAIVQFGINDSAVDVWNDPPATEPRISLDQFRANMTQIIDTMKDRDIAVVLMTPNPLRWAEKTRELYGKPPYDPNDPDGFNVTLRDYVAAVRELAREKQVPLIDVFAAFDEAGEGEDGVDSLLVDGMHPNDEGHRLVADLLLKVLLKPTSQELTD